MTEAAQGQGQATSEGGQSDGTQVQSEDTPRTYDQKSVNKIAANEKREGKQSAISELLEKAREVNPDVESLDDVFSGYSEYQGIQEAVTTEADRANEKAERFEKRAKASEEREINRSKTYALKDALRDRGVPSDRLNDALTLADRDLIKLDKEFEVTGGLEDAVEALLEPRPWLLETQDQTRLRVNAPQTNGTGVQTPTSNSDPEAAWQKQLLGILGR